MTTTAQLDAAERDMAMTEQAIGTRVHYMALARNDLGQQRVFGIFPNVPEAMAYARYCHAEFEMPDTYRPMAGSVLMYETAEEAIEHRQEMAKRMGELSEGIA